MAENLLAAAGLALYGEGYIPSLARALGVNDRTVQRWVAGSAYPPRGIWRDVLELIDARHFETRRLRKAIAALLQEASE